MSRAHPREDGIREGHQQWQTKDWTGTVCESTWVQLFYAIDTEGLFLRRSDIIKGVTIMD